MRKVGRPASGVESVKLLTPIDLCNKVLQGRAATFDVEVANLQNLILQDFHLQWKKIWKEAVLDTVIGGITKRI